MLSGASLVFHDPAAGTLFSRTRSARSSFLESQDRAQSSPTRSEPSTQREWARLYAAGFKARDPSPIQDFRIAEGPRAFDPGVRTPHVGDNAEVLSKDTRRTAEGAMDIPQSIARQQRRLISLTDQVLLKRTQVLHQEGNVRNCRRFFNASLKELDAAIELWEVHDRERRKARKARKARTSKTKTEFDEAINADSSMAAMGAGPLEPSAAAILTPAADTPNVENEPLDSKEASSPIVKQPTLAEISRTRQTAYDQYRIDCQAFTKQERELSVMTDQLSSLEYELAQLHRSFAEYVKSINFAEELQSSLANLDLEANRSSRRASGTGTETPPLVSEYFEQKGDAGVYRERLDDLEYSFQEGLVQRELIAERGDKLDVSDEEFRQTYDERRKDLNEEITVAEEKAANLARRCAEAGLDIEQYRQIRPSEPAESTVDHGQSAFGPKVAADEPLAIEIYSTVEPEARAAVQERPSSKVGKWLRTVPEPELPVIAEGWIFADEADAEEPKEQSG